MNKYMNGPISTKDVVGAETLRRVRRTEASTRDYLNAMCIQIHTRGGHPPLIAEFMFKNEESLSDLANRLRVFADHLDEVSNENQG